MLVDSTTFAASPYARPRNGQLRRSASGRYWSDVSQPTPPFTIRSLANAGTTLYQLRDAVLRAPPETNLVLLRIQSGPVHCPPVCPNCEQPATSTLRIERAFLIHVQSDDDTPNDTLQSIDTVDVPFCEGCFQQQRAQLVAPSPWTPLRRILSDAKGFAGVVVMGVALLFLNAALERLSLFPLLLAAMPISVGFWLLHTAWQRSRHMAVPTATSVDLAFDFTPSLALPFEPNWRAFLFRSARYAALFRRANIAEFWNPNSMEAQTAAAQRQKQSSRSTLIVGVVLGLFLLWVIWDDYLAPVVLPYFQR